MTNKGRVIKLKREQIISALQVLVTDLVTLIDGFIDENFIDKLTIEEQLITEIKDDGRITAHLDEDYEYNLFNNLFYDKRLSNFYHYTSFQSLFQIVNSGKIHLNSLIGLNDRSEINWVNNYMGKRFENPYHPITMQYHNSHFLFCLSEKRDQLNQWRLYGDDAQGVMIEFDIDHYHFPYRNILISKITYNLEVFEKIKKWLAYCKYELKVNFGFQLIDYWKFFYKNDDYRDEAEIRLLVRNLEGAYHLTYNEHFKLNRAGIIVPYIEINCLGEPASIIKIKNILLGPKFNEPDINVAQLQHLLTKKYPGSNIRIAKSRIEHYR